MHLYIIDGRVNLAKYKVLIDINNCSPSQLEQLFYFQNESNDFVAYSEGQKDQIISIIDGINYTVEEIAYENETLEKVKTKKYNSRSEALQDLDVPSLSLDEYKKIKVDKLSAICNTEILTTFTSSAMGISHTYSFDYETQINFTGTKDLFRDDLITQIEWNTQDAGNIVHNKEQFNQLYIDGFNHKMSKINKFRAKKEKVNSCSSKNEVDLVEW